MFKYIRDASALVIIIYILFSRSGKLSPLKFELENPFSDKSDVLQKKKNVLLV